MIRRNVRQGRCGRLQKSPSELARFDLLPFFTSGAAPAVAAVAATMLLFACAGFHNPGVSADGSTAPQQTFDATQAERVIMWPTPTKLRASEPAAAPEEGARGEGPCDGSDPQRPDSSQNAQNGRRPDAAAPQTSHAVVAAPHWAVAS